MFNTKLHPDRLRTRRGRPRAARPRRSTPSSATSKARCSPPRNAPRWLRPTPRPLERPPSDLRPCPGPRGGGRTGPDRARSERIRRRLRAALAGEASGTRPPGFGPDGANAGGGERGAGAGAGGGQRRGGGQRGGFDPAAMLKEFDKDGDGQLSAEEQQTARDTMRQRFAAQGGPPRVRPRSHDEGIRQRRRRPAQRR